MTLVVSAGNKIELFKPPGCLFCGVSPKTENIKTNKTKVSSPASCMQRVKFVLGCRYPVQLNYIWSAFASRVAIISGTSVEPFAPSGAALEMGLTCRLGENCARKGGYVSCNDRQHNKARGEFKNLRCSPHSGGQSGSSAPHPRGYQHPTPSARSRPPCTRCTSRP